MNGVSHETILEAIRDLADHNERRHAQLAQDLTALRKTVGSEWDGAAGREGDGLAGRVLRMETKQTADGNVLKAWNNRLAGGLAVLAAAVAIVSYVLKPYVDWLLSQKVH